MPFAYYHRLRPAQKKIYRKSDRIHAVTLPEATKVHDLVASMRTSLTAEDRRACERAAQRLGDALLDQLGLPRVQIRVLAARPSRSYGELHGLYETEDAMAGGKITLWMRTARKRNVVAFKSFLRTFLHELCHHLDYTLLGLDDSFHTEGFFRRESSLFHQLVATRYEQTSLF